MAVERAAELISLAAVHDVSSLFYSRREKEYPLQVLETVISQTSLVLLLTYLYALAPGAVTK